MERPSRLCLKTSFLREAVPRAVPDLTVNVHVARPRAEVLAWWTQFPDDYRAQDPQEQPHRIVVRRREPGRVEMLTYWRGPLGREVVVPETFLFREGGDFDVELRLPLGLAQHDRFTFTPREDGGTDVRIEVDVMPRQALGRLTRGAFLSLYARRQYPRTWREAARLCERDAPRLS